MSAALRRTTFKLTVSSSSERLGSVFLHLFIVVILHPSGKTKSVRNIQISRAKVNKSISIDPPRADAGPRGGGTRSHSDTHAHAGKKTGKINVKKVSDKFR